MVMGRDMSLGGEKINNSDEPLAKLTMYKRGRTQITNISNKKWDNSTDPMSVKRITKGYWEKFYAP